MLARISAAKKYKEGGEPPGAAPGGGGDDMEARRAEWEAELRRKEAAGRGDGSYSALLTQLEAGPAAGDDTAERGQPARSDFYTNPDAPDVMALWEASQRLQEAAGRGSANQTASWLAGVLSEEADKLSEGISQDLRPEEFTIRKEARTRQAGADIITSTTDAASIVRGTGVDKIAAAAAAAAAEAAGAGVEAGGGGAAVEAERDESYKPKVTTWGVFPRPQNISAAYGGGRNIKPGEELETKEQKAKREAEYAAALERYKQQAGLTALDPDLVAKADAEFMRGQGLMSNGQLVEALAVFNEVREMIPLKTRTGGMATLQAAICNDTLGNTSQAQALYKRVKGHPHGDVSRRARHLMFGFQAMDFLKMRDASYNIEKKEYDKYFSNATLVALGVVLAPVAVFAVYALAR
ncbi:MAG: hypothetical protein J3K34DRAFT_214222 [Monoraphidium minutum]|nr:MAG: hypothetical protein J3K34DRAFT_214222 [Monoraphidium minutum]